MIRLSRYLLWLVMLTVLTVTASSARAQTWTPFGPSDTRYDLELFKAPDISDYPDWPHPAEGFFFQYERLYWSILQPKTSDIGVPGSPANSLDDGFLGARETWGNRYDLGFVEDNAGWFVSVLNVQPQIQQFFSSGRDQDANRNNTQAQNAPTGLNNATVTFLDINLNPFPITFPEVDVKNYTSFDGVEINRTYRYQPDHNGSIFQLFFGVRWLGMTDSFHVNAPDNPGFPEWGGSFWNTDVHNNIFGPQIGLRFDHSVSRWDVFAETRFMPGVNFETVHQQTMLDLTPRQPIPPYPSPQSDFFRFPQPITPLFPISFLSSQATESWASDTVFAAVGEFRTGVSYKLTQAISVQAGYNCIVGTGITRAARRVGYGPVNGTTVDSSGAPIFVVGQPTTPLGGFSILDANKREGFFTNGLSLGITVNR